MADIIYTLEGGTYFNITNKCPCNCAFCIRSKGDAVGDAEKLWFDKEPDFDEIKNAVDNYDFTNVDSAIFCGYGEPTNAYDNLIKTARYLKKIKPEINLRLNTNGLSDLINSKPTAKELSEVFDYISVSLNEPTSEKYDKITRNIFNGKAFDAMLDFTRECVKYCKKVRMTVVDVITEEEIEEARKVCESTGAEFKVRSFEKGR
ncbi:MAG: TIGR04100 family radical SAM protein [Acetobacter sp.]|nr:TIGR04100 family radical SAM protein [Bacteroides sp.]MCM1341940.1 TIGR04100 family radical SAM protein [Acetobacter sp.]MCM1434124.1 TIGR04100 family radical SAM protein [Clostridiales bacterium]